LASLSKEQIFCRLQQIARASGDGSKPPELTFDQLLRVEKPEAFISEAYRFILKREATPDEIEEQADHLRKGISKQVICSSFASSEEARELGTRCPLYWTEQRVKQLLGLPFQEFVPAAYRSLLWREPDPVAQRECLRLLDQGTPPAYLLYQIGTSPEAKRLGARLPVVWMPRSVAELLALPDESFLACSFQTYLWREPDVNELNHFVELIGRGAPRIRVLFQLFTAASAIGLAAQFPSDWLPKTVEEFQTLPEAGFLPAAYRTYLWRDPDSVGLRHYSALLERGTPRVLVLYQLACSEEAKRFGTEFPRDWIPKSVEELLDLPDDEFLETAYRSFLWRRPDPEGLCTWRGLLAQGIPRPFILYQIASSEEARKAGATFPEHWTPKHAQDLAKLPDCNFPERAYRSILWRLPDRREAWTYAEQLSNGRPPVSILREIASSEEARRIPIRIAGLDSLQNPRPRPLWLLRKKTRSFLRRVSNSILGLDRRFEALQDVTQDALLAIQRSVAGLELEFRNQGASSRDLAGQEFDKIRMASVQLEERLSGEMREQLLNLQNLTQRIATLQSSLAAPRAVDEYLLAAVAEVEQSIQRLPNHASALAELTEKNALLSEKLDASASLLAALTEKNAALLSGKLDASASLLAALTERNAALLSGKLDDSTSLLVKTVQAQTRNLAVPLADNLLLTKVRDFYYFIPAEDAQLVACLVIGGHLEPGLADFMEKWVQPGMTVVDVGANIGLHSLSCAKRVGPEGRVYCFEPSPRIAKILQMNLVMNQLKHQAVVQQVAVTDGSGTASFYLNEICGHSGLFSDAAGARAIDVQTESLDSLLAHNLAVDLVKIDAEGSEPMIIRGMSQIIERNPGIAIVLEFAPSLLERTNNSPKSFLEQLHALGFELMRIDDTTGALHALEDEALMNLTSSNLLLRKSAKAADARLLSHPRFEQVSENNQGLPVA
jgi:FkbM family methyltransferase